VNHRCCTLTRLDDRATTAAAASLAAERLAAARARGAGRAWDETAAEVLGEL
jgi:hypothetical protein